MVVLVVNGIIDCPCSKWRTQHQPVEEEVSVEALGQVTEAGAVGAAGGVAGGAAGVVGARRRRSGCQ